MAVEVAVDSVLISSVGISPDLKRYRLIDFKRSSMEEVRARGGLEGVVVTSPKSAPYPIVGLDSDSVGIGLGFEIGVGEELRGSVRRSAERNRWRVKERRRSSTGEVVRRRGKW